MYTVVVEYDEQADIFARVSSDLVVSEVVAVVFESKRSETMQLLLLDLLLK
jgi:hypothetical protein